MNMKLKTLFQKQNFLFPVLIFIWAFLLRQYFFCGFIMGDDAQEFSMMQHLVTKSPMIHDQLYQRFMGWFFNLISAKMFGLSETSFFLPTWLLSSSLSVFGYAILLNQGYSLRSAVLAGLMIASAPFEVLTGAVRINDLILSWFMIVAFWALMVLKHRPVMQGIIIAICLWLGFYSKLWIVYIFPLYFLYYGWQILKYKEWDGFVSFFICSYLLHRVISIFWKIIIGLYFPFFHNHAAHNAIAPSRLFMLFKRYPHMIFQGSEFGTTLFGAVPYLLLIALITKLVLKIWFSRDKKNLWDSLDFWLFFYYMSFFLLLNFFPNAFTFDAYYSVPRIFRYLTPISFPMTLHLVKLVIDIYNILYKHVRIPKWTITITFCLLIGLNIYHSFEATRQGRAYRKNLKLVVQEIKQTAPPVVLSESWLYLFLSQLYLNSKQAKIRVPIVAAGPAHEYEAWLVRHESTLPNGTLLITGLANFVFYGGHKNGFRLAHFNKPLSANWKLHKEFGTLDYLPIPEKVILWKLSRQKNVTDQ